MMKLNSLALLMALCATPAFADDVELRPLAENTATAADAKILPVGEKAFVDAIKNFDKASIIAQLGDPASADDVRLKGSNKVVASIWHYHNVNTDENGEYYETTELDFIDDKVVQVVFLNNDGSDTAAPGQKYEIDPSKIPQDMTPQAAPKGEMGDGQPMMDLDKK